MALQATVHNFDVELADNDRGVYNHSALPPKKDGSCLGAFGGGCR